MLPSDRFVKDRPILLINQRLADALASNNSRHFWHEVKLIRHSNRSLSQVVDGCTDNSEIADIFAAQYYKLYTSVSYDVTEMRLIREDLGSRVESEIVASRCGVDAADVVCAIAKLKPGKYDGYAGLHSDHLINACKDLSVYISLLFSAMLVHGCASEDMSTNTIIPIPKAPCVYVDTRACVYGTIHQCQR